MLIGDQDLMRHADQVLAGVSADTAEPAVHLHEPAVEVDDGEQRMLVERGPE